ncbi:MAG: PEP-CTERM sorting domain-containing protein [Gammaproteobacteria bacterium]|nr:PEP-CTERM sorting domain-containing protein [Gammaproteobacteria bacterium]
MKLLTIKTLLASTLLLPFVAGATPITGNIAMIGQLSTTCDVAVCGLNNADGLIFLTDGFVIAADGDFAANGVAFGSLAAMSDFSFDPFATVDPLWTVSIFSFALESIDVSQGVEFLELSGAGTVSGLGFDDTAGLWTLSSQGGDGDLEFSWSSTALAAAPEPGILMLMGLGLIGGLGARRLTRPDRLK